MKKYLPLIGIVLAIFLMYFGNSDRTSIERKDYILGIGIDKSDSKEGEYKYTFYIPKSSSKDGDSGSSDQSSKGSNETKGDKFTKISVNAKTIFSAMDYSNGSFSDVVSLSHVKVIVISDMLSKDDIDKNIESTFNNTLFRHTALVAMTSGKTDKIFENLEEETQSKPDTYFDFIKNSHKTTGLTSVTRLKDYYNLKNSHSGRAVIAYIGSKEEKEETKEKNDTTLNNREINKFIANNSPIDTKNKVSAIGLAVFDDSKKVDILNGQQCVIYNILKGQLFSSMTTIQSVEDKDKAMSFCCRNYFKPDIKVKIIDDKPKIDINITLIGFVSYDENRIIQKNDGNIIKVKEHLEKFFYEQIMDFLNYTSKEIKTDVVSFGNYAKINFMTIDDFNNYKWNDKYKDAEFNLKVSINLSECRL
jgi:spore germination protein KC